jgi:hypothetical protein
MKNTITVTRQLCQAVSLKEGTSVCDAQYPGSRLVINPDGVKSRIDVRDGKMFFDHGIATKTKFYVFRNRKEQNDWLRDRI